MVPIQSSPREVVFQTDVFIVCFNLVSPSSFDSVKCKWVPEIRHHCSQNPIVVLVGRLPGVTLMNKIMPLLEACYNPRVVSEMYSKRKPMSESNTIVPHV